MGETTWHTLIMLVCVVLINVLFLLCQSGANLASAALFEVPPTAALREKRALSLTDNQRRGKSKYIQLKELLLVRLRAHV